MGTTKDAIDTIYDERRKFAIIGLTGRTGSGCTTVANILKTQKFDMLALHTPKDTDFRNSEERKYRVIYNYISKNWSGFKIIEMSIILASFIFQEGYDSFENFISDSKAEFTIPSIKELKEELIYLKKGIDTLSREIKSFLNDDNRIKKDTKIAGKEVKCLSKIQQLCQKLKEILKKYSISYTIKIKDNVTKSYESEAYTYLFQLFGNNVRASGSPYSSEFTGKNMFDLAERANDFIKIARNKKENGLFCIDALRNPYEIAYFQDRYSAFYTMAIDTDNEERLRRLSELNSKSIESLDTIEYPEKLQDIRKFNQQNIGACLEISDIHIYNPHSTIDKRYELTSQVVKYVALMLHPGIVTPDNIERCMQTAYNAKLNSGCLSRQVGAVITNQNFSIKSVGWNDVPAGQVPCSLRDVKSLCINKDPQSHSKFEIENKEFGKKIQDLLDSIDYEGLSGRLHPYCFKDIYDKQNQVHTRALHAEENAFLQLAKYGSVGIENGYLFTTASPCELCSKKAYQLGIKKIYYIDPYPGISKDHILTFGDNNPEMLLFHGAIGCAYTKLYSQRVSIKDELKMLRDN